MFAAELYPELSMRPDQMVLTEKALPNCFPDMSYSSMVWACENKISGIAKLRLPTNSSDTASMQNVFRTPLFKTVLKSAFPF